jgi:hypothetical protein
VQTGKAGMTEHHFSMYSKKCASFVQAYSFLFVNCRTTMQLFKKFSLAFGSMVIINESLEQGIQLQTKS